MARAKKKIDFDESVFGDFTKSYDKQCLFIRQAIDRFRADLKRSDLEFDINELHRFEKMCSIFSFYLVDDEKLLGQPIKLMDWQKFVVANLFCFKYKKNGKRRFRRAYIEIPRKNAKTFFCSLLAIYLCICDNENAARIYIAANSLDQANEAWSHCKNLIDNNEELKKHFRLLVASIEYDRTKSFIRKVASDSKNIHGKNISGAICDELHVWRHRDLWDVIFRSTASRRNPLMVGITTAGTNQQGIAFEQRTVLTEVLSGRIKDDRLFGLIFTIDDGDDWQSKEAWQKANPSLGITKTWDYMNDAFDQARNSSINLNDFLNYDLNIWTNKNRAWLQLDKLESAIVKRDISELKGKRCYVGVDLALSNDLTAVALCFPTQEGLEKPIIACKFFMGDERAEQRARRDQVPYDYWHKQGLIDYTTGDMTDFNYIEEYIKELCKTYNVEQICYDPALGEQMYYNLTKCKLPMFKFRQTGTYYSEVIDSFEKHLNAGKLEIIENECLKWCLCNVELQVFNDGHVMPNKLDSSTKRIDGAVAALMAFKNIAWKEEEPNPNEEGDAYARENLRRKAVEDLKRKYGSAEQTEQAVIEAEPAEDDDDKNLSYAEWNLKRKGLQYKF